MGGRPLDIGVAFWFELLGAVGGGGGGDGVAGALPLFLLGLGLGSGLLVVLFDELPPSISLSVFSL